MRKAFSSVALMVCGWWCAGEATASPVYAPCDSVVNNLVANCGFETGDFTSWSFSGNTTNPSGNYYGVDTFDANSGTYGAYLSQDVIDGGTAALNMSQTLATTLGSDYLISFYLEQDTGPTSGYNHAFTATLGGTTLLTLTPTVATPGTVGSFVQYIYSFTATSTSSVLNFAIENDDSYWSLDDLVVSQTTAAPEPSTFLLGAAWLSGLLLLRRGIARGITDCALSKFGISPFPHRKE